MRYKMTSQVMPVKRKVNLPGFCDFWPEFNNPIHWLAAIPLWQCAARVTCMENSRLVEPEHCS
jgi:hypothetical protein